MSGLPENGSGSEFEGLRDFSDATALPEIQGPGIEGDASESEYGRPDLTVPVGETEPGRPDRIETARGLVYSALERAETPPDAHEVARTPEEVDVAQPEEDLGPDRKRGGMGIALPLLVPSLAMRILSGRKSGENPVVQAVKAAKAKIGKVSSPAMDGMVKIKERLAMRMSGTWQNEVVRFLDASEEPKVILQIGAGDGKLHDPVRPLIKSRGDKLRAIFVEPVPTRLHQLHRNYEGTDIAGKQGIITAVSETNANRPFYYIDPEYKGGPRWLHGLGSFDRTIVAERHRWADPDIDEHTVETQVYSLTIESIVETYEEAFQNGVDIVVIDSESSDLMILHQVIAHPQLDPKFIRMEIKHLSDADKGKSQELLEQHGYRVTKKRYELFAVKS